MTKEVTIILTVQVLVNSLLEDWHGHGEELESKLCVSHANKKSLCHLGNILYVTVLQLVWWCYWFSSLSSTIAELYNSAYGAAQ